MHMTIRLFHTSSDPATSLWRLSVLPYPSNGPLLAFLSIICETSKSHSCHILLSLLRMVDTQGEKKYD